MKKYLSVAFLLCLTAYICAVNLEDSTQFNRIFETSDSINVTKSQAIPEVKGMNAMQYIGAIFIIGVLLYIFYKLAGKMSLKGKSLSSLDKDAKVIDIIHIGNKQYIYLVYLLDVISVLGVSSGNIQLLYQISDEIKIQEILEKKQKTSENPFNLKFSEKLLKRKKNEKS